MIKPKDFKVALVFLTVAFSLHFFEQRLYTNRLLDYIHFSFLFALVCISIPLMFNYMFSQGFNIPVALLSLSTIVSMFMAYYSWDQDFLDSLKAGVPYMVWTFYFYLLYVKVPVTTIEKIITIYGIIYIVLYFFQLSQSHTIYFGWKDEFSDERGFTRIIFPGAGVFYLSSFLALNKFTSSKRFNFIWIAIALLGIVIPVLQVTRQNIIAVALIYTFHFIRDAKLLPKLIAISVCIFIILYSTESTDSITQGLLEVQQETSAEGENYVRVLAAQYFIKDFSPSTINLFLGNGVPGGTSYYKLFEENLKAIYGYYLTDIGIVAAFTLFGIFAIIAYLLIFIKSVFIKLPSEYSYLKYYIWYLVITCLTSSAVYHYDFLITNVFALYCFQRVYEQQTSLSQTCPQKAAYSADKLSMESTL